MLNKVQLIGHLGGDPELRYTPNQTPVANFSLATTKRWNDRSGNAQEQTEWHRVVVWNKLAEIVDQYLGKGRQVYVEGELRTNRWTDAETGQDRSRVEIVGHVVQFLGRNPDAQASEGDEQQDGTPAEAAGPEAEAEVEEELVAA